MRFPKIMAVGLAGVTAAGLAGCSGSGSGPSAAGGSAGPGPGTATAPAPAGPASSGPTAHASHSAVPGTGGSGSTGSTGGSGGTGGSSPVGPKSHHGRGEPETQAGARAAATRFYRLYTTSRFAASWDLLSAEVRRQVPRRLWIGVHVRCPVAAGGTARVITAVTVFGNAAIVTERVAGTVSRRTMAEDVFNYFNGRWGYSPSNLGIYHHRSVAADVAAARAAGLCGPGKAAPL
jgi:hypothetical protein